MEQLSTPQRNFRNASSLAENSDPKRQLKESIRSDVVKSCDSGGGPRGSYCPKSRSNSQVKYLRSQVWRRFFPRRMPACPRISSSLLSCRQLCRGTASGVLPAACIHTACRTFEATESGDLEERGLVELAGGSRVPHLLYILSDAGGHCDQCRQPVLDVFRQSVVDQEARKGAGQHLGVARRPDVN